LSGEAYTGPGGFDRIVVTADHAFLFTGPKRPHPAPACVPRRKQIPRFVGAMQNYHQVAVPSTTDARPGHFRTERETVMNAQRNFPLLIVCVLAVLGSVIGCCCVGMSQNYPVKGRVVASKHEITGSYLRPRTDSMHDDDTAIPGAKVYLAFDEKGERPVPGYEARSDDEGLYEIDTKDIPPSERKYGEYFLVVEKEGYQSVRRETGLRFMAPYITNTAVLKP
jgi:hypothetical protein